MKSQSVFVYFVNFLRALAFLLGASAFLYEIGWLMQLHLNNAQSKYLEFLYAQIPELLEYLQINSFDDLKNFILWIKLSVTVFFSLDILMPWLLNRHKKDYFLENYFPLGTVFIGLLILIVGYFIDIEATLKILANYIFLAMMLLTFIRYNRYFVATVHSPATTLMVSFVLIICLGALFLSMPHSTPEGQPALNFEEAIFMSTSATCVTGLSVVPLTELSTFGQGVILTLIQIGGLGLLTFVAVFALTQRRGLGLRERVVLGEALNFQQVGKINRLVRYIFIITVSVELLGALFLYFNLPNQHWAELREMQTGERIYVSLFTSISAFCNAGFSLYDNSLMNFQHNSSVCLIVAALIIIGGLGFAVIMNIKDVSVTKSNWARRFNFVRQLTTAWEKRFGLIETVRMTVQSKLMLTMTAIVLAASFLMFYCLEFNSFNRQLSYWDSITACFFQAVTLRTAGFNTMDFDSFTAATLLFSMFFMLLGGGPGGTAGGLKISTLAMMIFSVEATASGSDYVEIFKRRIPRSTLSKALVVVTVFVLGFLMVSGLVFITETVFNPGKSLPPIELLFESASAYATVGLSTGMTSEICTESRIVLIFAMIAGRIGPLTLILTMGKKRSKKFEYPKENIMIG